MNCRRVRKLMPLFVEGDLHPSIASRLASHLEWCGRCNWLADEYRESQSWLHTLTSPELDEVLLGDVKHGVLTEIAATRQRPAMLALIAEHWNRRRMLALSAAVLMILGMVGLYVYQSRVSVNPSTEVVRETPPEEAPFAAEVGSVIGTRAAPGARSQARHPESSSRRRAAAHAPGLTRRVETRTQMLSEVTTPSTQTVTHGGTTTGSKEMLRIEIQTSNPLIRIIWFAPIETDPHQSKPATD